MPQYFVQASATAAEATVAVASCKISPVFAIAKSDGKLEFCNEQGELQTEPISFPAEIAKVAFQPNGHTVAVGLVTGMVCTVRATDFTRVDDPSAHSAAVSMLVWSADGSRLVSGDTAGVVALWKVDPSGRHTSSNVYRKTGIPTECTFISYPGAAVAALTANTAAGGAPAGGEEGSMVVATVPVPTPGATSFIFSGDSGVVTFANDAGVAVDVLSNLHSTVDVLEYQPEHCKLIVITRSLLMTHLSFSQSDGKISTLMRTKLSIRGTAGIRQHAWIGGGLMGTTTPEEAMVRCWDFAADEHFHLSSTVSGRSIPRSERICALAFSAHKGLIAAGSEGGSLFMWRRQRVGKGDGKGGEGRAEWEPVYATVFPAGIVAAEFVGVSGSLTVQLATNEVVIVSEALMHRKIAGLSSIIQVSNREAIVERRYINDPNAKPLIYSLKSNILIKGLDLTQKHALVWNGKACEVYQIPEALPPSSTADAAGDSGTAVTAMSLPLKVVASFKIVSDELAMGADGVFACTDSAIQVYNMAGLVKHTVNFSEAEGHPTRLDCTGRFLAVATAASHLRVYDISRVEPRLIANGRFENSSGQAFGEITSIKVNMDGSRVAILASRLISDGAPGHAGDTKTPDTTLYVYGVDADKVYKFDVQGRRYPVYCWWDDFEHRLLGVQTERMRLPPAAPSGGGAHDGESKEGQEGKGDDELQPIQFTEPVEEPDTEVITLFISSEADAKDAIVQQDSIPIEAPCEALLAVTTPYIQLLLRSDAVAAGATRVVRRPMRDFVGMEDADDATRRALTDFSYYMATGNMDEAYKAVKLVANPHIWENMAQMCVKSKRMDVAAVCLGHMQHARGAKAIRDSGNEDEVEANVAQVAVQLGMLTDAARLYQQCGRYDLLSKLYKEAGAWDRAVAVTARHDRMHLKSTYYEQAKYLERCGDVEGAIKHYELSGTHRKEVPRMLHEMRDFAGLMKYVNAQNDKELFAWYGQYLEAQGNGLDAYQYYQRAGDAKALVRLACSKGDMAAAIDLVHETNDAAAAYQLARHLEASGRVRDALQMYEKSGRYNHAVRLAKSSGSDAELVTLALQSEKSVMLDVAHYFEAKRQPEKAVQLYHRAGSITRAIDLCFQAGLYADLASIAEELGEKSSPELLKRCAEFFMTNGQFDKAVNMLITAKRFDEAIDMCAAKRVTITESMAEAMTPPKVEVDDPRAKLQRNEKLMKLAKVCKKQGSYHLATKKYTQAGDKVKAMKSLLKTGDTEKITFFANVSRSPDVYILAANYLQTLAWHTDADILKNITEFYSKAKAYEQLSSFYEACSTIEIDDFRNYEKALTALKEALKHAEKIKTDIRDARIISINIKINIVEKFVAARKYAKTDFNAMVEACKQLLEMRDADSAIRIGDVYALLIYYFYQQKNWKQAHHYLEEMRSKSIPLDPFVEVSVIEQVYRGVGIDPHAAGVMGGGADMDNEIKEEIESSAGAGRR